MRLSFERIGRLKYKGLNSQTSKFGWFALVGSTLHAYLSDSPQGEEIQLRKLNELCEWNTIYTISCLIGNTYTCLQLINKKIFVVYYNVFLYYLLAKWLLHNAYDATIKIVQIEQKSNFILGI